LTYAAKRSLCDQGFLEVSAQNSGAMHAFSFDHAGIDSVHANLLRSQLARQHTCDGVDGALGAGVDGRRRRGNAAYHRADIDDATALANVFEGCLSCEQQPEDVDVEHSVELIFGNPFDRGKLVNT
jgi:hypothetical protein